ncbi:biotin/lipoyl-containing protein, partial [Rhizobiaceae sp. 2RAB30]
MGEHVIKLPDVGEGVAEAELVEWHVKVGDLVREDSVLAAVMTDKATVEIPSPVDGEILWLGAEIGDTVAVGSPLVRLKVEGEGNAAAVSEPVKEPAIAEPAASAAKPATPASAPIAAAAPIAKSEFLAPQKAPSRPSAPATAPRAEGEKPLASPAVRLRATEAGIDLRQVPGTGPA